MSTSAQQAVPAALPPVVVSDTGFLLSVAATRVLLPALLLLWPAGRAIWPKAVLSELQFRVVSPGNGVPAELASGAIAVGQRLLGVPIDLDDDQRIRADTLAVAIGGTDTSKHAGEAAGAILAQDRQGLLATADLSAARVIKANTQVRTVEIGDVLRRLVLDERLTDVQVDEVLRDLRGRGRPGLEEVTVIGLRENTWRQQRGY